MRKKTLQQIGLKWGTDKATHHNYLDFYERHFKGVERPKFLEIGHATGVGIATIMEFFGDGDFYSFEINPPAYESVLGQEIMSKITYFQGDQGNRADIERFKAAHGGDFDIILDDGSHLIQHQQLSLMAFRDSVKHEGVYIIEDLHTSFRSGYYEPGRDGFSTFAMLQAWKKQQIVPCLIPQSVQRELIGNIYEIDFCVKDVQDMTDSITAVIKFR